MRKILFLVTVLLLVSVVGQAQSWKQELKKRKSTKELTLKDYQKAFDKYWKPYNLDKGYYINENGEKQKARGWKQFKRWEYYWETQVDPKTGDFPSKTAYQEFIDFHKTGLKSAKTDEANWVNLGTNSSNGGYAGIGRINCIAYHPSDNNTYWVGTPAGGVWVTRNNGSTWEVLTDANTVLGVSDIAIPSDYATSKTIYIATGDRDGWDNRSIGILKSTDDGETWQATDLSFTVSQGAMCTRLLIDPNDDDIILAATSSGVYKTTNGGDNWNTRIAYTSFIDMEHKPGDFNTLYGSTKEGNIYTSTDGGSTWNTPLGVGRRIELAVTPAADTIVYAVVAASDNGLYGVYKSTDSGASFSQVFSNSTLNLLGWDSNGSDDGGQGWYDLAIAVSPTDADVVLVGGVNTWRSTDGGSNFSIINHWWGDGVPAVHADKHMLSFRSNGDLFECNDGGIYLSLNDGSSWTDKTDGIVISQMYKLGVSQQLDNEVITGLQDNGTKLYSENKWWDVKGGDGMECLIDYTDYKIQYGTYVYGQISRTTNWWSSSTDIEPTDAGDGAWVTPYIIDPVDHNTLYAGYADVWKTTNKGDNWTKISSMNFSDKIRSMAIAPSDNNTLYVGSRYSLYKTTNGGSSWEEITSGLSGDFITYIAVKHNDPETLWVSLGGYDTDNVYESTNGGETWSNISQGLPSIPANSIVQDKTSTPTVILYVGTEAGVYRKMGDNNWELFNKGLPNVKIGEIEIYYDTDPLKNKLRAATYGRGLWETLINVATAPEVSLATISEVDITTVSVDANITSDAGYEITESGIVYSKFSSPTIDGVYSSKVVTNPLVNNGAYTLNITNLDPSTVYYVRAYAVNIAGAGYSNELQFVTSCSGAISMVPYVMEFSVDSLPGCWSNIDNVGNNMTWQFDNPASISFNSTTAENGFASLNSEYYGVGNNQNADLLTPEFDFTDFTKVNISFEHLLKSTNGAEASLSFSLDNGSTWSAKQAWSQNTGSSDIPAIYSQDLSNQIAGEGSVIFKVNVTASNDGYYCIDDILIDSLFTVFVTITDIDGFPIQNAEVIIDEETLLTNLSGQAFFRSVSGTTVDYEINATGYVTQTGTIDVSLTNVNLPITLKTPPSTDATLSELNVGGSLVSGFNTNVFMYYVDLPAGTTELPEVTAVVNHDSATYEITQATLENLTAEVAVTAEDEVTVLTYRVQFNIPTFIVTFTVKNKQNELVQFATVNFLDKSRSTGTNGIAVFTDVLAVGDTVFEVLSNDYKPYEGDVSVVNTDVDVDVVLDDLVGNFEDESKLIEVYPNPTSKYLNISINKDDRLTDEVVLVDAQGKVVFKETYQSNTLVINLDGYTKGNYLLSLEINDKKYVKQIVVE